MNMKEFAHYLNTVSFDEALHHVRKLSYERVVANEQMLDAVHSEASRPQHTKKAATA